MHTNGGCMCLKDLAGVPGIGNLRVRLVRALQAYRQRVRELEQVQAWLICWQEDDGTLLPEAVAIVKFPEDVDGLVYNHHLKDVTRGTVRHWVWHEIDIANAFGPLPVFYKQVPNEQREPQRFSIEGRSSRGKSRKA